MGPLSLITRNFTLNRRSSIGGASPRDLKPSHPGACQSVSLTPRTWEEQPGAKSAALESAGRGSDPSCDCLRCAALGAWPALSGTLSVLTWDSEWSGLGPPAQNISESSRGVSERRGILWRWRGPSGLRWVWRNGRGPGFGWGSVPVVLPGVATAAGNAPGAPSPRTWRPDFPGTTRESP